MAEAEGRYSEASVHYRKSLQASQQANATWIMSRTYRGLGIVAQSQGDYLNAKDFYLKSLGKRMEIGDKRGLVNYYSRLSAIALGLNDMGEARLLLDKSYETMYGTPSRPTLGLLQFNKGLIEQTSRQSKAAMTAFRQCLAIRQEIGERRGVARAMEAIGRLYIEMGKEKKAAWMFGAASSIRTLSSAPLSPNEEKKYRAWIDEARKKSPKEYENGEKKMREEIVIV